MYEDIKEYMQWARKVIDEEIEKQADVFREKFMLDISDVIRGGKRFRPTLTLLTAQAIAGDDAWQKAIDYAVAVEMIHSFSLNIDDILDIDAIRRGKPAEWVIHGLLPAFLAGIGGITQAFALGSKNSKAMKVMNETIQAMATGAVREMVSGNVLKRDFLENIIILKTAALTATATQMGAIAVNAPYIVEEKFRKYGLYLGMAYQMQDDLNDIILSMVDMKPHGDLRDFRLTLPLYIIHTNFPSLGKVIDDFLNRKIQFKTLANNMMNVGGKELFTGVTEEINRYVEKAILEINTLSLHEKYRKILLDIPYYMVDTMRAEVSKQWIELQKSRKEKKEVETAEKEEIKEEKVQVKFEDWLKTLPPTHIAAVTLIKAGFPDSEVIEKSNITEKELQNLKDVMQKMGYL